MSQIELIIIAIGTLAFIAIFAAGYAFWGGRPNLEERIHQEYEDEKQKKFQWRDYLKVSLTVLKPIGEMIPRSPQEMSRQERRLTQAGIRRRDAAILFTGAKLVFALVCVAL